MIDRISDYGAKARVLRQIMSNKGRRYNNLNTAHTLATVVLSSFLTFLAFAGTPKVLTYIGATGADAALRIEIVFNAIVFTLFVLLLLHHVFHFTRKQADAERAIVSLTSLINFVDDLIAGAQRGHELGIDQLTTIRQKYETLTEVIPANSDREYELAKEDVEKKEVAKQPNIVGIRDLFSVADQRRVLEAIVRQSGQLMMLLETLRQVDGRLYVAGGPVRNTVWDYLHAYPQPTALDDVDVVYFDRLNATKEHDRIVEEQLRNRIQNQKWSVKNQARMHVANSEPEYESLEDAVSKWPETATAIAVRLTDEDHLEVVAPHGFDDLFRLVVAPTPHFWRKIDKYRERIVRKQWRTMWPNLRLLGLD
jgi:hypothetical protein